MATTPYYPSSPVSPRPAIPTEINIGKVAQVIAMYDLVRNKAFIGGSKAPDKRLPELLCVITETLDWYYNTVPDNENIESIANYLWALITPYQIAAERALNIGGVVIDPNTGTPLGIEEYREDFVIGGSPAPRYTFAAGDTSYTVPLNGFFTAMFFASGSNDQIGLGGAGLNSITYNKDYVRFNLNQAVQEGEQYTVWGLRGGNITSVPSTGVTLPQPYKKGQFLTNDGTNLEWDDVIVEFTAADFEPDGRTYLNSKLANYTYDRLDWLNLPTTLYVSEGDFTPIDGGGITISETKYPDFDATQNPDWKFRILKRGITS